MLELVENLRAAYRQRIEHLPWMTRGDQEGRAGEARRVPPQDRLPGQVARLLGPRSPPGDAFGNVARAAAFEWQRQLQRLGGPTDRGEWGMTPQTINAYYNPTFNEVVFPAAILQPPFFDPDADAAVNYGGIGGVIGHEMGHGFDDQGAKSDARGVLHTWWQPEDTEAFHAARRSAGSAVRRLHGAARAQRQRPLTLGENIGDLGGLSGGLRCLSPLAARQAARRCWTASAATSASSSPGRRSGASKQRDEELRSQVTSDPHSPPKFRDQRRGAQHRCLVQRIRRAARQTSSICRRTSACVSGEVRAAHRCGAAGAARSAETARLGRAAGAAGSRQEHRRAARPARGAVGARAAPADARAAAARRARRRRAHGAHPRRERRAAPSAIACASTRAVSRATRIEVVTEGVLTRLLQEDPALEGVAAVIFDEFHERSLQADLGAGARARCARGADPAAARARHVRDARWRGRGAASRRCAARQRAGARFRGRDALRGHGRAAAAGGAPASAGPATRPSSSWCSSCGARCARSTAMCWCSCPVRARSAGCSRSSRARTWRRCAGAAALRRADERGSRTPRSRPLRAACARSCSRPTSRKPASRFPACAWSSTRGWCAVRASIRSPA